MDNSYKNAVLFPFYNVGHVYRQTFSRARLKPSKECALPGCCEMTTHNGGYCCAEHCKRHKEIYLK